MNIIDTFTQPFMLQALFVGILVGILLAVLGVFITLRNKAFLVDGISHGSLAGIAIGLVLFGQPLMLALMVAVLIAVGITYFQKNSNVQVDSLIGIFYTVFFALGVLIINLSSSYQPDITRYLFGSLLFLDEGSMYLSAGTFFIVFILILFNYSKLLYVTFDPEAAYIRGIKVDRWELLLNIMTSMAIVIALKLIGVVMVSGLVIIPASIARLLARDFKSMIPVSILASITSTILGIVLSYYLDVPSGASIVMIAGIIFLLSFLLHKIRLF